MRMTTKRERRGLREAGKKPSTRFVQRGSVSASCSLLLLASSSAVAELQAFPDHHQCGKSTPTYTNCREAKAISNLGRFSLGIFLASALLSLSSSLATRRTMSDTKKPKMSEDDRKAKLNAAEGRGENSAFQLFVVV